MAISKETGKEGTCKTPLWMRLSLVLANHEDGDKLNIEGLFTLFKRECFSQ